MLRRTLRVIANQLGEQSAFEPNLSWSSRNVSVLKFEKREIIGRDVPLGWRSLTTDEIYDLKANDRISVLCEEGIETRVFLCAKEGFVWSRKTDSTAVFFKTVPANIVTVDPDRSEIHDLIGYDS